MVRTNSITRFAATGLLSLAAVSCPVLSQLPPKPAAAPAAQPPPPPKPLKEEDVARVLKQLESLADEVDAQKFGRYSAVIRQLKESSATGDKAFNLWMDCMKEVEYDQKGKTLTEFAEWKRRIAKETDHKRNDALQLQVQWLMVVLMDASARSPSAEADVISAAASYLDMLAAHFKKYDGDMEHLGGSVLGSVFAKKFKVESAGRRRGKPEKPGAAAQAESADTSADISVPGAPGDLSGIYESLILPYYRTNKMASSLMSAWTRRISQETAMADIPRFREAREKFVAERLPVLEWGRARELFMLGQEENGAQAMMDLIRKNLSHRDAGFWAAELRGLVETRPSLNAPAPGKPASKGDAKEEPAPAATTPADPAPAPVTGDPAQETPAPGLKDPTKEAENPFGD